MSSVSAVLAIDQGTTGSTAIVFSRQGTVLGRAYSEFNQHYPQPGWVEHDPEEIWQVSRRVMAEALRNANLPEGQLAGIGITNQRETTVVWDRETGVPVHRAVVWQSRQSASICQHLKAEGHEPLFRQRTGLVMDAYFAGTKIRWILNQDPELQARAEAGELAFGTIDSWLLWKLTGGSASAGAVHLTEPTNASRTLLYNIHELDWDPELCRILNVPRAMLPEVKPSSSEFGRTVALEGVPEGIPIAGMAGDQQAALFGQACWYPGQAKNTYGTGCFLLMNMGDKSPVSSNGLLTTICCDAHGKPAYALEGSVFIAGAAIQWLRDELGIIHDAAETAELAGELESNDGVYLVPAFAGLGAPYWDSDARGVITGLTRGTGRRHLVRAALESVAYQSRDIAEAMNRDSGVNLAELKVDGGAANNDFLMQFQADMLNVPVDRPRMVESTAAGSAFLAGLATGLWDNPEELKASIEHDRRFEPSMTEERRDQLYRGWQRAVARARSDIEPAQASESMPQTTEIPAAQPVKHHTRMIKTADDLEMFAHCWLPEIPTGVIVLVHGLAEHAGRYDATARYLASTGWAVYACDLRGHGLSPDGHRLGRVHVDAFLDYFHDVRATLTAAAEAHPDLPRVLLGHSMGGLIALRYAIANPVGLKGAIISSPALGTHPDFQPPAVLKLMVGLLSRLAPRLMVKSELDTSAISRDPEVVKAYVSDPLVSEKVSVRWYASMMRSMKAAHAEAASLRIPMLLMQSGADRLVDPAAPGRWAQSAPKDLVELQVWEGFYHEMLNEPEKDRVLGRISDWLTQYAG